MSSALNLNNIIDMEKWQKLQDSLSLVTKMAVITTDYKGVPVTKHSQCQSFCQAIRQDEALSPFCEKCDARGGLEAVRLNKPYMYRCHFNIIDIAIPIIVNNQYIGAIMAGQVKMKDNPAELEQIVTRPPNAVTDAKLHSLEQEYASLPELSYDEITTISDMLFHLCHYIVEEAILKNETIEMYQQALATDMNDISVIGRSITDKKAHEILQLKVSGKGSGTDTEVSPAGNQYAKLYNQNQKLSNSILQPAFDYIYSNKQENYKLTDMADLCHVSPSYFSRIFTKETGENFSVYVPRLKVEWAKKMLENSDLPISQISNELGFTEPSYFIKTFKKYERTTPAVYRQMHQQ